MTLHTLCGIKGQSHSCAEELLHCIFNGFGDDKLPQKLLFLLASNVSISYGNTIAPQHSVFFPVVHVSKNFSASALLFLVNLIIIFNFLESIKGKDRKRWSLLEKYKKIIEDN